MSLLLKAATVSCMTAALVVGTAQAQTYVLAAPAWGANQNAAVGAAGGSVVYSHVSGLAVVSSDSATFLADVLKGGAIQSGVADMTIEQAPVQTVDLPVEDDAVPAVPNDTYFQYVQWAPQSIGAPAAWAAGFTGKNVRVAVIDGGVYDAHPDLAGALDTVAARSFVTGGVPGIFGCPATAWNCDTGTFWHGTHVSGIIAARANNGIGVAGIAPEATVVPVKALHDGSGSFSAVIAAILYAATDAHVDIINMSLGAVFPRQGREAAELVSLLNRAVNTASSMGVLVISAAGNNALDADHSGNLITTPAQSGNGLAVSATGPLGFALGATDFTRVSSYTNYGYSLVSVAAPGGDFVLPSTATCSLPRVPSGTVTTRCYVFDMVLSTSRGVTPLGGYSWAAGTSMAAPAASAVAALIKQRFPNISVGELKNRLALSADDLGAIGFDPYYGRGYINAYRAVTN